MVRRVLAPVRERTPLGEVVAVVAVATAAVTVIGVWACADPLVVLTTSV